MSNQENLLSALRGMQVKELLRQRGNMLMLDTLLDINETGAVCEWMVNSNSAFYVSTLGVPSYAAIECMAQCIAALAGARARVRGMAPPVGLLLGTRQFQSTTNWMQPGQSYRVECQELMRDEQGMASFDCRMIENGETMASCRLAVFERESGISLHER